MVNSCEAVVSHHIHTAMPPCEYSQRASEMYHQNRPAGPTYGYSQRVSVSAYVARGYVYLFFLTNVGN